MVEGHYKQMVAPWGRAIPLPASRSDGLSGENEFIADMARGDLLLSCNNGISRLPNGFERDGVWRARGRGFQMGAIQPDGVLVHLTGQVAWTADEQVVGLGDVEIRTRKCFENISLLLDEVGGKLSDIVSLTTYFTDRSQLPIIQKIRAEFLDPVTAPVSTSVMVAGLGHEDFLVEFTPIAVIPKDRFVAPAR